MKDCLADGLAKGRLELVKVQLYKPASSQHGHLLSGLLQHNSICPRRLVSGRVRMRAADLLA